MPSSSVARGQRRRKSRHSGVSGSPLRSASRQRPEQVRHIAGITAALPGVAKGMVSAASTVLSTAGDAPSKQSLDRHLVHEVEQFKLEIGNAGDTICEKGTRAGLPIRDGKEQVVHRHEGVALIERPIEGSRIDREDIQTVLRGLGRDGLNGLGWKRASVRPVSCPVRHQALQPGQRTPGAGGHWRGRHG